MILIEIIIFFKKEKLKNDFDFKSININFFCYSIIKYHWYINLKK